MILTVTVLLSLLEFLDEVIARLLTAWGAVRTQNILISHCTVCVIPTYRQAKPLPLPESNLYHTFFSSQNTTNLQDPVHPQPLGNGGATDLQPLGNGGTTTPRSPTPREWRRNRSSTPRGWRHNRPPTPRRHSRHSRSPTPQSLPLYSHTHCHLYRPTHSSQLYQSQYLFCFLITLLYALLYTTTPQIPLFYLHQLGPSKFPPPPLPIQSTPHEVPNPSHTQYSSMTLFIF